MTRLRDAGFEVEGSRELWGEARAFALMPGGQRVEVMAAPPPSRDVLKRASDSRRSRS